MQKGDRLSAGQAQWGLWKLQWTIQEVAQKRTLGSGQGKKDPKGGGRVSEKREPRGEQP